MGIDLCLDPLVAAHPRFRPDRFHPVGETRNEAQILADMLLANPPGRDDAARRKRDRGAEDGLREPDSSGMLSGQSIRLFWKTSCRHWGFLGWHR